MALPPPPKEWTVTIPGSILKHAIRVLRSLADLLDGYLKEDEYDPKKP